MPHEVGCDSSAEGDRRLQPPSVKDYSLRSVRTARFSFTSMAQALKSTSDSATKSLLWWDRKSVFADQPLWSYSKLGPRG